MKTQLADPTLPDIMDKLRVLTEDLPDRDLTTELYFIDRVLDEALQFCPTEFLSIDDGLGNWFEGRRQCYRIQTSDGVKIVKVPNG